MTLEFPALEALGERITGKINIVAVVIGKRSNLSRWKTRFINDVVVVVVVVVVVIGIGMEEVVVSDVEKLTS